LGASQRSAISHRERSSIAKKTAGGLILSTGSELADAWFNLIRSERLALCALARISLDDLAGDINLVRWAELTTDQRRDITRAMRMVGDLAVTCAIALKREQQQTLGARG
jgi:hypothetical protein